MSIAYVTLDESYRDKDIMILSLNHSKTLNAIDIEMLKELQNAIHALNEMSDIKVLIIKSSMEKAFSTGVNTSYVSSLSNDKAAYFFSEIAAVLKRIEHLPCITVAAISGYAYGAGADLALACDIRIGRGHSKFRFPGPQFGLILGTNRLINELGPSKSRFLTLTNKMIEGNEALAYGLLHQIVEGDEFFEEVLIMAIQLTKIPAHSFKIIKHLTNTNEENNEAVKLAGKSVLESDFSKTFNDFLNTSKDKRRGNIEYTSFNRN